MEKEYILDEKDLALLSHIYHSKREPFTKIAKKTKLSRIQVEYHLNKLEKEGIIKKYLSFFNYGAFGFSCYLFILIKLEDSEKINILSAELEKSNRCISWGKCFGKYDVYANMIFKNEEEANKLLSEIITNKKTQLNDYMVLKPYLMQFFPLKKQIPKNNLFLPYTPADNKKLKFDKDDIKILIQLEKNGKERIINIAKKTNLPIEKIIYRIKRYNKEKIFTGIRTHLNMKKLGYNYSGLILQVNNLSEKTKKDLLHFAETNSLINAVVLSMMKPNCFLQVFHKTEQELKQVIQQVKKIIQGNQYELEILLMDEEDKINTLPFLHSLN